MMVNYYYYYPNGTHTRRGSQGLPMTSMLLVCLYAWACGNVTL